ncbi:hypothetical protein BVX98_02690 [bacterium F11]|nr:hypothetical protein BVX98_02690 [bacterium F11]
MKVKKFRIRPRIPTVKRILKSLLGTKQLPVELESSVEKESEDFLNHCSPTAFYQTWPLDDIEQEMRNVFEDTRAKKAVSFSAMISTIGAESEELISQSLMKGETNQANLLTALGEETADLSQQFLLRLLVEDAKQDDCEIGDPILIKDGPLLDNIITKMGAEKENVSLDSAGHLTPRFTRVSLAAWIPVSKKRNQHPLIKRGR